MHSDHASEFKPASPANALNASVAIVIPARLESTRLPRKLLLRETGKSVLQHTYEAACRASIPGSVIVAADHDDIAQEVKSFGGQVVMTDPNAASGTDRVAEVAKSMPGIDILVNVQGDEPEIDPESIDAAARFMINDSLSQMTTLATPIRSAEDLADPACVKVVFDSIHRALYFSRAPIPYCRDQPQAITDESGPICYQHIGLYAYRREFLLRMATLPASRMEKIEGLEQLRVLEAGIDINVAVVDEHSIGIDTRRDYDQFLSRYRRKQAA